MLYEFAVEPACLANWQVCRYIVDQMGAAHGRMIAEFPRRKLWKRMVRDACDAADVPDRDRLRIVEKLKSVNRKMIRARRAYDESLDWVPNAVLQHERDPFHAIVCRDRTATNPACLVADSVDEREPLWRVRREDKVPRTAEALARYVSPLLQISSQIRFVDKLFDPEAHGGKWCPMLEACLRSAIADGRTLDRVEYHTIITGDRRPSLVELQRRCHTRLPRILPRGLRLRVVFWRLPSDEDSAQPGKYRELFHARYILTNRGGYRVETGLDVGAPGEQQDVSLLDDALREQRWNELDDDGGVFEFAADLWIPA